jgi:hypothetical protein
MAAAKTKGQPSCRHGPARSRQHRSARGAVRPAARERRIESSLVSLPCAVPGVVTGRTGDDRLTLSEKLWFAALNSWKRTRTGHALLRGEARGVPVTRSCWGGVFAAQYRDRFGWPPAASPLSRVPSTGHRCARLRRACGHSFRLRCSGAVENLDGCSLRACASTSVHTLCCAVLTTETHQILCGKYPPLHASRPSRPRLSPLRS